MSGFKMRSIEMRELDKLVEDLHSRISHCESEVEIHKRQADEAEDGSVDKEISNESYEGCIIRLDLLRRIEKLLEETYL